jgi:hypothetical protein
VNFSVEAVGELMHADSGQGHEISRLQAGYCTTDIFVLLRNEAKNEKFADYPYREIIAYMLGT